MTDHAQGRREGLEEAANLADELAIKWWTDYKYGEHRADPHYQGMSDGAELITTAIRAKAKEAGHE